MKKLYGLVILLLCLAPALFAQEHYTEGPIWRVQLIRVKPTQMDAYLTSLRQSTKPLIEDRKTSGCDHGLQDLPERNQEQLPKIGISA